MRISIAADHGGFELKADVMALLKEKGLDVADLGCHSSHSVDYPDYAELLVKDIEQGVSERGILICGTGIGMSIAANRSYSVRAANCYDAYTAQMSREHNNANVLCLGARTLKRELALQIVDIWLTTEFCGGRHQNRIAKFSK